MNTTLNAIRDHGPCTNGWRKLLRALGKDSADDEPLASSPYSTATGWTTHFGACAPYPATTGKSASSPSGARARCST